MPETLYTLTKNEIISVFAYCLDKSDLSAVAKANAMDTMISKPHLDNKLVEFEQSVSEVQTSVVDEIPKQPEQPVDSEVGAVSGGDTVEPQE